MVALSPQVPISTLDPRKQGLVIHKNLNFIWLKKVAQPRQEAFTFAITGSILMS